ncbi:hypothetical protein MVLG_00496 [Microbotryum lychnidis-dioicae p1A1 Lamole]|uniref:Uncharacterized protein n=1 Tax=Microbotryum lychnidis-dioicae (strain p1A1 Lamole / MvSl-1064) TaxID=683840 RepID=U5GZ92_USTV1|nr:hypothetical protein MVLG_00496 [Microbotryum lychnidis-dioicae p1A1 Lamole]|eukprot:KDE09174.1 hypothetical protein MVLG_00496 [Microbotryum lychnidis-dioicae p1A1 Lamole]
MLDLILPKLWASQLQFARSKNSYQLHIETPPKNRRQQGDGDFVLLINGEVRSVVSFESKRESVIDGYAEEHHDGPRFPNGEFRFADTAAVKLNATLPETPHTSGILFRTAIQSVTASKHHRIEVR